MSKSQEIRSITCQYEIRQDDEGLEYIEGYALKFDQLSENLGGFIEIIDKNALNNTNLTDVTCLINHDRNYILARTEAGNLNLEVDGLGLKFKAYPSETSYYSDLKANMRVKNINKCSFAFMLNWENKDCEAWVFDENKQVYIRTLKDIAEINDVSVVTNPAYKVTEVVINRRGLDNLKNELEREVKKRKLSLELELI